MKRLSSKTTMKTLSRPKRSTALCRDRWASTVEPCSASLMKTSDRIGPASRRAGRHALRSVKPKQSGTPTQRSICIIFRTFIGKRRASNRRIHAHDAQTCFVILNMVTCFLPPDTEDLSTNSQTGVHKNGRIWERIGKSHISPSFRPDLF